MKIMKKIATLAIVALMSVQLVACTNNGDANKDTAQGDGTNNTDSGADTIIVNRDNSKITKEEYNLAYEMLIAQYTQSYSGDTTFLENEATVKSIEENALSQLLAEKAIIAETNDITFTDSEVATIIKNYKGIMGDKWSATLTDNGFTEDDVKSILKARMVAGKYLQNKVAEFMGNNPSDEEIKAVYDANPDYYNQIQASHILVDTEEKALEIKKLLDEGGDFATLAQENSTCPSSAQGGDLGFFNRAQMVKEFSDVAFALELDEISEPVKTEYGYHIIKKTGEQTSFDTIDKSSIASEIAYEKFGKFLNESIDSLVIEIPEELKDIKARVDEQRMGSVTE